MDYFSHDYSSRQDVKIKRLIVKHGAIGYGLFWMIVEDLYANDNRLPSDFEVLAYDYRVDTTLLQSVIQDFDLFVCKKGFFMSNSVARRLNKRKEKSQKAKESASKRWHKNSETSQSESNANAMQTHSDGNAIKLKESKPKKLKESKPKDIKDVQVLFQQYLDTSYALQQASKFWDYYESVGWKVGRNIMKDWKAAARGWISRINNNDTNKKDKRQEFYKSLLDTNS